MLIPVPDQLSAMRGVLSVLGMDQASQAVLRMRDESMRVIAQPSSRTRHRRQPFERLAGNLGALGFLIDMLSVQPQLAKSLFVFDPDTRHAALRDGRRQPSRHRDMARWSRPPAAQPVAPHLIEQAQSLAFGGEQPDVPLDDVSREPGRLSRDALAADQAVLAETVSAAQKASQDAAHAADDAGSIAVREQLVEALTDFVATASEPARRSNRSLDLSRRRRVERRTGCQRPATGLEDDDEMRESSSRKRARSWRTRARRWSRWLPRPATSVELTNGAPRFPYAQGQFAHGRPRRIRRSCLVMRAALQRAPGRRAARRRTAAGAYDARCWTILATGSMHRRTSRRRAQMRRGARGGRRDAHRITSRTRCRCQAGWHRPRRRSSLLERPCRCASMPPMSADRLALLQSRSSLPMLRHAGKRSRRCSTLDLSVLDAGG